MNNIESKYKVGDKVRIKSLDWYNSNKDEDGEITMNGITFIKEMSKYCGEEFEIRCVSPNGICYLNGIYWCWSDWMFEGNPTFSFKDMSSWRCLKEYLRAFLFT